MLEKTVRLGWILLLIMLLAACGSSDPADPEDSDYNGPQSTDSSDSPECADNLGTENCPCLDDDTCLDGLVCNLEQNICKPEGQGCDELECDNLCHPPTIGDEPRCVDACEPGFEADDDSGSCVPIPDADCVLGSDASIIDACDELKRGCSSEDVGAQCGDCFFSHVLDEDQTTCRRAETCESLSCSGENKTCTPGDDGTDATCGDCSPGYAMTGSTCGADGSANCQAAAEGSILEACSALNKECNETPSGAICGQCKVGFHADAGSDTCVQNQDCSALNCSALHRECVPESTYFVCGDCLGGFVQDVASGQCRPVVTCDGLNCPTETQCQEATDNQDAYCMDSVCGPDKLPKDNGDCVPCPKCGNRGVEGEDAQIHPDLTLDDKCICKTKDNYYYDEFLQIHPCDADGDGWIRLAAEQSLNTLDPVLEENFRCKLRRIDRFELRSDKYRDLPDREIATYLLSPQSIDPIYLFEPDALDDNAAMANDASKFPLYGTRQLSAGEVNPLTKACVSGLADYNFNTKTDVTEGHSTEWPPTITAQDVFDRFSYFVELQKGWYEGPADFNDGSGKYVIEEKSRDSLLDSNGIALQYSTGETSTFWQTCERRYDSAYPGSLLFENDEATAGMDFAWLNIDRSWDTSYGPASADLLTHHSQFKCVLVVNTPISTEESDPQSTAYPNKLTVAQITSQKLNPNDCGLTATAAAPGTMTANPADPELTCTYKEPTQLTTTNVVWMTESYTNYRDRSDDCSGPSCGHVDYVRGCVNECTEHPTMCPGLTTDEGNPSATCNGAVQDYGSLECGCNTRWGQGDYDDDAATDGRCASFGCAFTAQVTGGDSFSIFEPRPGYWLCPENLSNEGGVCSDASTGYSLRTVIRTTAVDESISTGAGFELW